MPSTAPPPPDASPSDDRPVLAIVCNSLPPYRVHAHRRIAREIPELRLLTVMTHVDASRSWNTPETSEIGVLDLSRGEPAPDSWRPSVQWPERRRGQRMIECLSREKLAAVIVNGYNDIGRLKVIDWCRRQGVPVFVWADSNVCSERRIGQAKLAAKRLLIGPVVSRVDGLFACGRLGKEYWELYGAPPERIFISPYEPDYELIQAVTHDEARAALARHGLPPNRRRIVFSGRLVPVKRVDLLLDAFARIADQRPEWDLVILGDGPLREELPKRVPVGLAPRVKWLGFLAEQSEISRLYRGSDVLALPSDYEPWALVINEAVAAGMAVVATDVTGAAAELVTDGLNGRLTLRGDLTALADALRDVTDPRNIDRYKEASAGALADWRRRGDPVEGVRQALRSVGALPEV